MNEDEQKTGEVLLNLTATALPVFGLMLELQERMGERLPPFVTASIEHFLKAVMEAFSLLPEEELKDKVFALLPPEQNVQDREAVRAAKADLEVLFARAREYARMSAD